MRIQACKQLQDALEAITAIEGFISSHSVEDFLNSDMLQAAVERKLGIIGEALKKAAEADDEIATVVPELRQIIATRNRIIHVYDNVDHLILWDVVQSQLPSLMMRSAIPTLADSPQGRPSFQHKQQQDEEVRLEQQIAEKLRRLGYA